LYYSWTGFKLSDDEKNILAPLGMKFLFQIQTWTSKLVYERQESAQVLYVVQVSSILGRLCPWAKRGRYEESWRTFHARIATWWPGTRDSSNQAVTQRNKITRNMQNMQNMVIITNMQKKKNLYAKYAKIDLVSGDLYTPLAQ
jgi:hypothetical protein